MGRHVFMDIGGLKFHGPYNFVDHIETRSGVYAILCEKGGRFAVLEIGVGDDLNLAIKKNRYSRCWKKNCRGWLKLAAIYCDEKDRVRIAKSLIKKLKPTCN